MTPSSSTSPALIQPAQARTRIVGKQISEGGIEGTRPADSSGMLAFSVEWAVFMVIFRGNGRENPRDAGLAVKTAAWRRPGACRSFTTFR